MKTLRGYMVAIFLTVATMVTGAGTTSAEMIFSQIDAFNTEQFISSVNELEDDRYLKIGVFASNDSAMNTGDYAYNVEQAIKRDMSTDVISESGDILPATVVLALSPVYNKYNVQVGSRVGLTTTQRHQIEQAMRVEYGASSDVSQAAVAGATKTLELLASTPDIQPPDEPVEVEEEEVSISPAVVLVVGLGAVLIVFALVRNARRNRY